MNPTYFIICVMYSSLPNKRPGPNKRTGWNFDKNQISVQGGILIKTLEYRVKTGYFIDNKKIIKKGATFKSRKKSCS